MIDAVFILRVLTAIVWLANGIIRVKFYVDRREWHDVVIAMLSFACALCFGLSAYYHFIGL